MSGPIPHSGIVAGADGSASARVVVRWGAKRLCCAMFQGFSQRSQREMSWTP